MTDHGAEWMPKADVVDPADEYEDNPYRHPNQVREAMGLTSVVPEPTHEEKQVTHKLTATISDEAYNALRDSAKDGETFNDTVRRVLHKALKLPKPTK
jgi:hypothetical protein